ALNVAARRLRWSRRRARLRRGGAGWVLLAAWDETSERLAWRGIRRRPHETLAEYAQRAGMELADHTGDGTTGGPSFDRTVLDRLADTVTRARFSDRALPDDSTAEALVRSRVLARVLWDGAPLRLRLRWWFNPIPARSARDAGPS
ncbi:MAG: DUF4129 domain-containing protein, partial [Acidimicrobiaceae bacterium]|nr:DUF4129 domain-containing protein [Acidimicrobiaceae bacterium]